MKAITLLALLLCFKSTYSQFVCGTSPVTDDDGNVYNTVQIGSRCWIKENMRATHYANGQPVGITEHQPYTPALLVCRPGLLRLSLPLQREETVSLNVYNLSGKLVYHIQFSCLPGNNVIQCTTGPTGIYFAEVVCSETKAIFKAIGADNTVTGAELQPNGLKTVLKSDSIILTATSRYVFDYNHDPALGLQYGKLYTPMAALNTSDYSGTIQGICPSGWHVPTDAEWIDLEISCGMSPSAAQSMMWRGDIARSLMITGYEWHYELGTDDFGFAAKGSGWYGQIINGVPVFDFITYECLWWTYNPSYGLMIRLLNCSITGVYRFVQSPESAVSVRCIKDQ